MKCPLCKSELIITGQARLQTLVEHVEDPNGIPSLKDQYICSNKKCKTHVFGISWDEGGERFSKHYSIGKVKYIDDNDAPFGSFSRKINVEIHKDDENIHLRLGKYHLELDWKYKSDLDGNIISKKPSFKLWIDGVLYISGIRMFFYLLKKHYTPIRLRIEKDISEDFQYPKYSYEKRDWWRWLAPWVLRIIDRKTFLEISK